MKQLDSLLKSCQYYDFLFLKWTDKDSIVKSAKEFECCDYCARQQQ